MSEPGLSLDEETSPDIFSDVDNAMYKSLNSDDSMSIDFNEPEPSDGASEWKGVSMDEIYKGLGIWDYQELPFICPSSTHTVLVTLPLPAHGVPKPYPNHQVDKWCQGYIRMPHSKHSLYPSEQDGNKHCRNRWQLIQESLLQHFVSTQQLERAILSYNHIYAQRWDFSALHRFFSEVVDEEETNIFFETLMPKMIQLALQLPVLVTGPLPLLKRHTNGTISLSQLQIASLLANAFFCTFPRRNSTNPLSEYGTYPYINFNRLFSAYKEKKLNRCQSVMEKMKCIFHYFRRVTSKAPEGVVTIQRRYIAKSDCPKWDEQVQKLPPLHITSKGTIEADGAGLLQVDFANKYVGGAVLGMGCVQEEIRFVICPELLVTMLVTEELDDTEALIVCGVERYSKYEGYSNTFKWMGDFIDETPRDSSKRRLTHIVAIDALCFRQPQSQFSLSKITRELNKAYVGFVGCEGNKSKLPPIATGNWGCGAFRGNPKLKVLLQLMAAAVAGRSIVYYTFGDTSLRDDIAEIYSHFMKQETNIAHIFSLLTQYQEYALTRRVDFYRFLRSDGKIKPPTPYLSRNFYSKTSTINEIVIKKNISSDDKRLLSTNVKCKEDAEEVTIQGWLFDPDQDVINGKKTEVVKRERVELQTNTVKEEIRNGGSMERKEKIQDTDAGEKKKKPSLWEMLEDTAATKTAHEYRLSGLELLDAKQQFILDRSNNDFKASVQVESQSIDASAEVHSSKGSAQTSTNDCRRKSDSLTEKSGQKKISDFFQRTS